jgi:alpha-tubulin suppressor-like RCC1 family protein/fibronectin type 3 domain-containing protein
LGLGDTVDRLDPVFIDEPSQVWAVSAGDAHSIVLVSSGDVYAFGWNDEGQLGLGDNDDRDIPTRIPTLSGAKAIAAGRNHSLVLLESGDVYAFGRNNSGQLGLGDTTDRSTPTRITALVGAKAIAAGGEHSLVLLENGDVYTFGDNSYGQLGLGDQVGRSTPTKMPSPAGVKAIAAGWEHSLVISENRFAYAFGGNYYGQLGLGDQDDRSVPTRILLPREVRQIAAGGFHSLVVLGCLRPPTPTSVLATNGTYTAKVRVTWTGDSLATSYRVNRDTSPSGSFITGIGAPTGTFFDDTAVTPTQTYWYKVVACNDCWCSEPSNTDSGYAGCAPPGPPPSVAASDGAYSTKVRVTWGAVSGATKYEIYRDPLSSGSFATKVGETATTAFDDTGVTLAQVYWYAVRACSSCGCSELSSSESGFAGCPPPPAPTTIAASDGTDPSKVHVTWASVTGATKYEVYRALTASGPFVDKTGDATTTAFDDMSATFAQVYWYAVKACNACGCGSPSSADSGYAGEGNAYSVGSNCSGQLGLGDTANRLIPTCISALPAPVRALTASVIGVESTCEAHSLFLLENGDVYSCGVNYIGGLGLGDNTARNSPQKVGGLPEAAKCAEAGNLFSVVVLGNGDVYSFGSNFFGTLGIGSRDDKTTPVKLTGLPGPARVAACGWAHTLILLENGDVYTFGWNCNGQLGQNSKTDSWVPVKVLGLPGRAMSVGAGSFHSLVVLENGDVYGFGKNDQGQLGLGDTTDRLVPTKMQGLLGLARSVAAGGGHSLIMLENGDIDAVGLNNHGQLGRGNTDNSLVPVKVTGLPGRAIALDAAHFHSLAVLENGDVYAFGANYWGQLGLNNTTDQSTPQKVVLLPGTARAVAAGGCHSLFATGARRGSDLPAPLGLTATDGTHADRVRLTWSAVGGAASYVVQRAAGQNGTFVQIASASGTSFDDTGVTPGQLYCYRLASCDSAGCGAPSPIEMGNASTTITGTSSVFRVTPSGEVRADGGWYGAGLFLGSADIAEWVPASDALGAGTVLEADPVRPGTYRPSQCACSPWVAGVVSTQPGIVLGGTDGSTAGKTLLALSGIVPVKVTNEGGPIQPGDLLVSSSTPGYAMRWAGDGPCPCALVGKALGPMMEESGTILVLLTSH